MIKAYNTTYINEFLEGSRPKCLIALRSPYSPWWTRSCAGRLERCGGCPGATAASGRRCVDAARGAKRAELSRDIIIIYIILYILHIYYAYIYDVYPHYY